MSNLSKNVLGIDVAKRTLDVALIFNGRTLTRKFDNSPKGFKLLVAWLQSLHLAQVHACLEATGNYGEAVAHFLFEKDHLVSVVNPFVIKGYAQARLQRNKTDQADARLIALYCLKENPPLWTPPTLEVAELQALTRRIETLQQMLNMEQNRLETAPPKTKPSIKRMLKTLEKEIKDLQKNIKEHIDQNPHLKEQNQLLQTIPGISQKTSSLLLSEIEFARFNSAREVAAFAGVNPQMARSGTSLKQTKLSKLGKSRIRKGLYFPAIVAKKHNQIINEFAKRLEKNGKTQMQIVCASMRKLLHIAFGVLKHHQPFNPNLAFSG